LVVGPYVIHARIGFVADPENLFINSTVAGNTRGIRSEGVKTSLYNATVASNGQYGVRFQRDGDNLGALQLTMWRTVVAGHNLDCSGLEGGEAELDVTNRSNASTDDTCRFTGPSDYQSIAWPFFGALDTYDNP